jgi:5-methylcytosine-specific restriction enzyme A
MRGIHLKAHPLCEACLQDGYVIPAAVVDHRKPHRGSMALFWDTMNLQSLCMTHHNGDKQRQEVRGESCAVGLDGWRLDAEK